MTNSAAGGSAEVGVALRTVGAASRVYARLVADSAVVTALSPASPRRLGGYEFEVVVDDIVEEASDVVSLSLRRADDGRLPTWRPGAHIDVITPSGALRQYSLTGRPGGGDHYRIAVRRIPDGRASTEMHELSRGDVLRIRGPRNAFPMARAGRYFFVAAGIGITPIRAMIQSATEDGAAWSLYYHGRTRASLPFVDEVEQLARAGNGRVVVRTDEEHGIPSAADILAHAADDSALYVCGPAPLSAALREHAMRSSTIREFHAELFAPAAVVGGMPFTVHLQRSGESIAVGATDTALAALRRTRPDQPYSCRQGFCGACVVGLVQGRVDHRDRVLGAQERTSSIALCVSRAAVDGGVLVLDL